MASAEVLDQACLHQLFKARSASPRCMPDARVAPAAIRRAIRNACLWLERIHELVDQGAVALIGAVIALFHEWAIDCRRSSRTLRKCVCWAINMVPGGAAHPTPRSS